MKDMPMSQTNNKPPSKCWGGYIGAFDIRLIIPHKPSILLGYKTHCYRRGGFNEYEMCKGCMRDMKSTSLKLEYKYDNPVIANLVMKQIMLKRKTGYFKFYPDDKYYKKIMTAISTKNPVEDIEDDEVPF